MKEMLGLGQRMSAFRAHRLGRRKSDAIRISMPTLWPSAHLGSKSSERNRKWSAI